MSKPKTVKITRPAKKRTLGPLASKALERPANYDELPGREQWDIDKRLGILDWSGNPNE